MRKHQEYRVTEIGIIPREWKVVELGKFIDIYSGYAFKSKDFLVDKTNGIPVIKIRNLRNGKVIIDNKTSFVKWDLYNKLPDFQLYYGDVLIALSGATTGKIAVVNKNIEKALVNQRVGKFIIFDSNVLQKFFYFLAQSNSFKRFIFRYIGQSAQGNLSPNQIKKIKIPLPPVAEQEKIAEILSTVDGALEKVDALITRTERFKKGLMQELLTKGIGHTEFKETEIGRIPKEWKVVKVGESILYRKGTKPKILLKKENKGMLPYLTADSIRTGVFTQWTIESYDIIKIHKDDLILIWDGYYCGDVFMGLEGVLSSTMIKIEPQHKLDTHFLYYILKSNFSELNTKVSGMYLKHVNKSLFENLKIPLPPLAEQKKIAEMLSTIDKRLELLRSKRERLERLKKGLMNDLLTGRRRVAV